MSASWNGADLESDFSNLLGDTSTAFKARVLKWINDTQENICARHDWSFLTRLGQKVLTASTEQQSVITAAPGAATVAAASGGSLTDGSTYNVYVTFVESNGLETKAGTASADVSPTGANLTIDVSAIPTSSEPLVTDRNIYLQKDSGNILFVQAMGDNTTTTLSITANTTSTVEAPDFSGVRKYIGNPFIQTASQLQFMSLDQMRLEFQGTFSTGTPSFWTPLDENQMLFYPSPSAASTLSYYFQIRPPRIYSTSTSQPILPIEFKDLLKAGVIAKGYEYRDRAGQESKLQNYEELLSRHIRDYGAVKKGRSTVRDVVGDSDGFVVF